MEIAGTRAVKGTSAFPANWVAARPVVTVGKNGVNRREPPMSAPAHTQTKPDLRAFLHGLPGVDRVGAEARAATLASRSIKTTAKQWALDMAISMIDLTTLEGQDTPGKVRALCAKAKRPDPADPTAPMVAAVCVYPDLAHVAAAELHGSGVHVASVATAFPSGRTSLDVKLADVRRASWLAMLAGADFIKTSTGKVAPAATLPVTLVMLEAVRDFRETHGRQVGVKPAGGIRTAKDALRYLVLVNETAGEDWLDPRGFRLGASSLLNDLLMQRTKMATGRYSGPDYFTLD